MLNSLTNWVRRLFGSRLQEPERGDAAVFSEEPFSTDKKVTPLAEENVTVVAYDENLLERARSQWQFGDWESLARVERSSLQHHPDRAKLALLAAAGHAQLGNTPTARQLIRLAEDWGCSKRLIGQILIAGVHNSLGRAAASANQETRALEHFKSSVALGMPSADARLLTQARVTQQISQLGLLSSNQLHQPFGALTQLTANELQASNSILRQSTKPTLNIKQLACLELGDAWAGNTINTVIFRHHAILTLGEQQYTAFYVDERTLRLVKRCLTDNNQQTYDIKGQYNLHDAHNSISLGHDRQGHLHLTYDHHSTQLRYRRALAPHSIDGWSDEMPMTGAHEEKVTYPTFILPRFNYPLTLLYRDGVWNKGSARLKTYNEATQTWVDHSIPILSGAEEKPWTCNAYWNHPTVGSDGTLHLSFVWRTNSLGEEKRINNINICYAYSNDNGLTWHTSRGHPYQLPITPVNAETVYPVSPGSNLINQCSMTLDSQNRPHIVFYANDETDIPQYQHLWFDGARWHRQYLSNRKKAFNLKGGGTLQVPISRPEIVIDNQDNAYVIFRGDLTENKLAIMGLKAPNYFYNSREQEIIWPEAIGYAEPIIDRLRWSNESILSLLIQYNDQPNHDIDYEPKNQPIRILDLALSI